MHEHTIVCPRCGTVIALTSNRAYFRVHRDPRGRPVEMRVIDTGKVRHSCAMWFPRVGDARTFGRSSDETSRLPDAYLHPY
jgi:hypothetical protein